MIKPTHRVCHNVAAVYRHPDSSAEQISQIVWGAGLRQIDKRGEFTKVIGEDLYEGWIRTNYVHPAEDDSDNAISTIASLFAEVFKEPIHTSELVTRLTTGCRVVMSRKAAVGRFVPIELVNGAIGYLHEGQISFTYIPTPTTDQAFARFKDSEWGTDLLRQILNRVVESAKVFVGVPYLWGGTTPFGIDCSGFTQISYRLNGIQLLRDASQQWSDRRFTTVEGTARLMDYSLVEADLLFFNSRVDVPGSVTHVGIALGDGRFIHAAGKGRGVIITNCDDQEFGATFIGARRLMNLDHLSINSA